MVPAARRNRAETLLSLNPTEVPRDLMEVFNVLEMSVGMKLLHFPLLKWCTRAEVDLVQFVVMWSLTWGRGGGPCKCLG